MKNTIATLIAAITLVCGTVTAQPAGNLDPTFNGNGKVIYNKDNMDLYQDVKVQPDGRIVAAGSFMTPAWTMGIEVTRYMPDGSFDLSFGTGGHYNYDLLAENGAYKCLIQDDGKILVCGYTTDYTNWAMILIRLNPDGTPDATFGTGGVVTQDVGPGEDVAYAMALRNDGTILVAGYAQDANFRNAPVVLCFSNTGILDATFGTGGIATIPVTENDNDFSAVAVQDDGKILAAGHISNGMSWFSLLIARFDANGQIDPGYATGGVVNMNLGNVDDEFFDMKLTAENEAILAGFTVSQADLYYHLLVMKFDTAGLPVTSFGDNGMIIAGDVPYTFGDALALQTDGKIVVAGCTGNLLPENNDWAVWRFNPDGSADPDFGTGGLVTTEFFGNADEALGVALHGEKIIVAGKTRNAENKLDFAVAQYINDIGVDVPPTADLQTCLVSPNPVKKNGSLKISFSLVRSDKITFLLTGMNGKIVATVESGSLVAGFHETTLSLPPSVSAGMYLLKVKGTAFNPASVRVVVTD